MEEVSGLLREAADRAREISARVAESGATETTSAELSILLFERRA